MPVDYNTFIHPRDRATLKALKFLPGFETLVRTYMKHFDEKMMHALNMASKIRVGTKQLPQVYAMLLEVCEKLGIEEPELYVEAGPLNAYTFGDTKPFIVLYSGALNALTPTELKSVIAHECGHILCHHTLYRSLANIMLTTGANVLGPASIAITPVYLAMMHWVRCSELSADRVDAYVMEDADIVASKLMKLSGGILFANDLEFNFNEYTKQAADYQNMLETSTRNKLLQAWLVKDREHPFPAIRSLEIKRWYNAEKGRLPEFANAAKTLTW